MPIGDVQSAEASSAVQRRKIVGKKLRFTKRNACFQRVLVTVVIFSTCWRRKSTPGRLIAMELLPRRAAPKSFSKRSKVVVWYKEIRTVAVDNSLLVRFTIGRALDRRTPSSGVVALRPGVAVRRAVAPPGVHAQIQRQVTVRGRVRALLQAQYVVRSHRRTQHDAAAAGPVREAVKIRHWTCGADARRRRRRRDTWDAVELWRTRGSPCQRWGRPLRVQRARPAD